MGVSQREFDLFKEAVRREFDLSEKSIADRFEASKEAVKLALASVHRPEDRAGLRLALYIAIGSGVVSLMELLFLIFVKR